MLQIIVLQERILLGEAEGSVEELETATGQAITQLKASCCLLVFEGLCYMRKISAVENLLGLGNTPA